MDFESWKRRRDETIILYKGMLAAAVGLGGAVLLMLVVLPAG